MRVQVIHRDQRLVDHQAECLGRDKADEQRTGQTRRVSNSNGVQVFQFAISTAQRLVDDWQNAFDVSPRGDFRYNAVETLVQSMLRCDDGRKDFELIRDHRCCGFVTG